MPNGRASDNPPLLRITRSTRDGRTCLTLSGELDLLSGEVLRLLLARIIAAATTDVLIDASQLSFCDGTGLGLFVEANQQLHRHGRQLRIIDPTPLVRRVLTLSGLLHLTDAPGSSNGAAPAPG